MRLAPSDGDALDVVVTGTGLRCNIGRTPEEAAAVVLRGEPVLFDPWDKPFPYVSRSHVVGLAKGNDDFEKKRARFMGRAARFACAAARDAWTAAGMTEETARELRVAVIVGSGTGDVDGICEVYDVLKERANTKFVSPTAVPRIMASTAAANVAAILGTEGPGFAVSAACAGGAVSLVLGALLLRAGLADVAVVGGAEAANSVFHASFEAMRAYTAEDRLDHASRPFAADRSGFVFGEGAGILVLETRRTATFRGARPLGVLRGYAMRTSQSADIVSPSQPSAARTMIDAMANAAIGPSDVGYVNAHATGTRVGDSIEVRAIREVFRGLTVPYSSTKGYTGHSVSAAGAIEAILTLEMMGGGWLASSVGAAPLDDEFADYPPLLETKKQAVDFALSNSFGFGGACVSLVLGRAT